MARPEVREADEGAVGWILVKPHPEARLMLTGRDIICISSIDWDFIWQGHQQIMATLAANGNRVLFIENTGVRSPSVGDLGRIRSRLRNWWRGTKGFRLERQLSRRGRFAIRCCITDSCS